MAGASACVSARSSECSPSRQRWTDRWPSVLHRPQARRQASDCSHHQACLAAMDGRWLQLMAPDCSHHQACLAAMDGRWFNERRLHACLYDGNRKRAPDSTVDEARRMSLRRPTKPPPAPPEPHAPYRAPEPAAAASSRAPTGATACASTAQPSDAASARDCCTTRR